MWRCMRAVIRVAIIACELAFGNMLAIVKAILNNWQNLPFLSLEIYTISRVPLLGVIPDMLLSKQVDREPIHNFGD